MSYEDKTREELVTSLVQAERLTALLLLKLGGAAPFFQHEIDDRSPFTLTVTKNPLLGLTWLSVSRP